MSCLCQVLEGKAQYIEMAGNLVPVTKSGDQPSFTFHAFHENRLPLVVRVRDMTQMASARIAFMSESRVMRGDSPLAPTCTLNINLPEFAPGWGSKIDDDEESETIEQYQRSSKHLGKCSGWHSLIRDPPSILVSVSVGFHWCSSVKLWRWLTPETAEQLYISWHTVSVMRS